MSRSLLFAVLCISMFWAVQVSAELITICPEKSFWGSHRRTLVCWFDTVRGEEIVTTTSTSTSGWYTYLWHNGAIIANGGNFDMGGYGSIRRLVTNDRIGYSDVRFERWGPGILKVKVESDRTNLKIGAPEINQETGDMSLPHYVTTVTPFSPGSTWVSVKFNTYASNGTTSSNHTTIETRGLTNCVNSSRCFGIVRIPFLQRNPIPIGHNWQYATINDQRAWAETTYDDNTFRWNGPVDDFFPEKIPQIFKNRDTGWTWEVSQRNLDAWINRDIMIKSSESGAGIDWSLPTFNSVKTDWLLIPSNATNNRIIAKFQELISPSYFGIRESRVILADSVRARFQANPSLKEFNLSRIYDSNISAREYHQQHISHIVVQEGGIRASLNLDPITAAFGGFSFYLVPVGKATRAGEKHKIEITGVRVHVIDSFDFNDWIQPLGCFKEPNIVQFTSNSGARCVWNSDFRRYRFIKARGGDYNYISIPKYVALSKPLSFLIRTKQLKGT